MKTVMTHIVQNSGMFPRSLVHCSRAALSILTAGLPPEQVPGYFWSFLDEDESIEARRLERGVFLIEYENATDWCSSRCDMYLYEAAFTAVGLTSGGHQYELDYGHRDMRVATVDDAESIVYSEFWARMLGALKAAPCRVTTKNEDVQKAMKAARPDIIDWFRQIKTELQGRETK